MSDFSLPPEIQREVGMIRQLYISKLPEKARDLEELKAACESSGWDGVSSIRLKQLAHQLAGSLGIHELDQAQSTAEALDVALEQGGQDPAALARLLDELIRLLVKL